MSSGMWNRTLIYLGLKEEPEEDYEMAAPEGATEGAPERFVPEDDPHAEHAAPRPAAGRPRGGAEDETVRPLRGDGDVRVRPVSTLAPGSGRQAASQSGRAAVVEIAGFDDVPAIGSRYRTGQAVLFDLSGADAAEARRVVDFVSGLTYALRGKLTKVGGRAFLLVPDGVHLPAEERRRLDDLGYRISAGAEG
ncbi:MAG TPA: cell division protein SepF [Egicoccus sp.]|nr:cell division protein SepF [Egicoccus sp.]HSK22364.1 cell division protein SepF [Egicoccus sp.]